MYTVATQASNSSLWAEAHLQRELICRLSPTLKMLHQRAHSIDALQAEAGEPVAIYGEGKEHAMAIGITKMSTKEMREINKGHGVDVVHYLNDGLWKTQQFA